jgi:hypothetical protein
VKRSIPALSCTVAVVATMTACGGGADKSALPTFTAGSDPSSASSQQAGAPKAVPQDATANGPAALAAHSTTTYGGLKFVVNLPTDIPSRARTSMTTFSGFLQGIGRTMAQNRADPALNRLASADIVKETQAATGGESVKGIGFASFTITMVQSSDSGFTRVSGCLDQSKLVQVRKDGSDFVDSNVKKYPTLKMTADVTPGRTGNRVTRFASLSGSC